MLTFDPPVWLVLVCSHSAHDPTSFVSPQPLKTHINPSTIIREPRERNRSGLLSGLTTASKLPGERVHRVGYALRRWGWGSSARYCQLSVLGSQQSRNSYLALATGQRNVDETASVRESLLRAALTIRLSIRESAMDKCGLATYGVFFFSCFSTLGV